MFHKGWWMKAQNDSLKGFTLRETMTLTGHSSIQLANLEKMNLIVPTIGAGDDDYPAAFFSWEQLIGILVVQDLKDAEVMRRTARKILEFLIKNESGPFLSQNRIAAINDDIFWINQDRSDLSAKFLHASSLCADKKVVRHTLVITPEYFHYVNKLWEAAKKSEAINFSSFQDRAKVHPS